MAMIVCTKCGRELPADHDHFHHDCRKEYGFSDVCRECRGYQFGKIERVRQHGLCAVEGCDRRAVKKGYCERHYRRWAKHGDPLVSVQTKRCQLLPRVCEQCGVLFTPKQEHRDRPARFCSRICAAKGQTHRPAVRTVRFCVECGKRFLAAQTTSKYCSQGCLDKSNQQKKQLRVRTCPTCGKEFVPRSNRDNPFCSMECYRSTQHTCEWCGRLFIGSPEARFCSLSCQRRAHNKANPFANRASSHRRKARMRKARIEPVNLAEICERDGWRCMLCGKRVDPKLHHPHPMSASIDHLIPIANGGTHEAANVQLAHLSCNMRKGNRAPVQLRMLEWGTACHNAKTARGE